MSETVLYLSQSGSFFGDEPVLLSNVSIWNIPRWQAGVRFLASMVSPLRRKVIQEDDDGQRMEQKKHGLTKLLNRRCNAYAGPVKTFETWITHMLNYGNGYLRVRRLNGLPWRLENVNPLTILPFRVDGVKYFYEHATRIVHMASDFLHLMGLSDDGVSGHNPAVLMQETFETVQAMQRHQFSYFKRGTSVNGVVTFPVTTTMEQAKAALAMWQEQHAGADKAGNAAFLPFGATFGNTTQDNQQSQLKDLRKAAAEDLLVLLMPALVLGDPLRLGRLELCRHIIEQIEDELTLKLLSEGEIDDGYCVRVDTATLNRNNLNDLIQMVNAGLGLPNEARAAMDMPPIPGGDVARMPINVAKAVGDTAPATPADTAAAGGAAEGEGA
jgi:HK97 family phage portal protein